MVDGNIVAAHSKLRRAVERLCSPRYGVYQHVMMSAPSLYEQLCTDLAGTQGDNKTPAKSLPPMWIDAAQLKNDIDKQSKRWRPRRRGATPELLAELAEQTWRPQDTDSVNGIARTVNQWCESIVNLIDPESVKHISAPCPSCGRQTVYRRDKAGDVVRQPALRIVTNIGCTCAHCDAHWAPDKYLFLCKLLGFDLPEGVLE